MRYKTILLGLALLLFLSGCETSLQKARAYREVVETNQSQERHELQMARDEALIADRILSARAYIWLGVVAVSALVAILLYSFWVYSRGAVAAEVEARHIRARLIPLDPNTFQYPVMVYETRGRHYLINPNTNSVLRLVRAGEPLPLLVEGSARVQQIGVGQSNKLILEGDRVVTADR